MEITFRRSENQMSVHQQVMNGMTEMAAAFAAGGLQLQLPPASNQAIGTEYIQIELGKSLSAKIPFDARFTNPLKMYQGGFLCAALDEVFGPLSYIAAGKPVVTVELSTTFIRPFTAADEYVVIKAEIVALTKSLVIMCAEVKSKEGKLIATSKSHSLIKADSPKT